MATTPTRAPTMSKPSWQAAIQANNLPLARQLLKQATEDKSDLVKGQLYEQAGTLARQQNMFSTAIAFYNEAISYVMQDTKRSALLYGWLAELYAEQGLHLLAKANGTQALLARDAVAQAVAPQRYGIAFSIFGAKPEYCETLILNAELIPEIYPNWDMLVYHDHTVPAQVLKRLGEMGAKLIHADDIEAGHLPGTFWRFFALERPEYAAIIMRDADSLVSMREKLMVDVWLASDRPVHVIHDWYSHTDLMLAGLWGVRGGLLAGIRSWIAAYVTATPQYHPTHADQDFLAQWVWPRVKPFTLHHSGLYEVFNARWSPHWSIATVMEPTVTALGAWQMTVYQFGGFEGLAHVNILEGERQICSYVISKGQPALEFPRIYRHRIENGQYQLKIVPVF